MMKVESMSNIEKRVWDGFEGEVGEGGRGKREERFECFGIKMEGGKLCNIIIRCLSWTETASATYR